MIDNDDNWRARPRVKPPQKYPPEYMLALNKALKAQGPKIHLGWRGSESQARELLHDFRRFIHSFQHFQRAYPETYEALCYWNIRGTKKLNPAVISWECSIQTVRFKADFIGLAQAAIDKIDREWEMAARRNPEQN